MQITLYINNRYLSLKRTAFINIIIVAFPRNMDAAIKLTIFHDTLKIIPYDPYPSTPLLVDLVSFGINITSTFNCRKIIIVGGDDYRGGENFRNIVGGMVIVGAVKKNGSL